jgi:hypothetical protein
MSKTELFATALDALWPLFVALLSFASFRVAQFVAAKTKNQALAGILTRANEAVFSAVSDVAQTYVDDLKRGAADGKLTDEERDEAKRKALGKAKRLLGSDGMKLLAKVLGFKTAGQADEFLSAKIEDAVRSSNGGSSRLLSMCPPDL